jgi:beta-xylosidase
MNIITYSEVEFVLAEAAAVEAFGVNDKEDYYKKAIGLHTYCLFLLRSW